MMTHNAGSGSASKRTTALRSRGAMLLQLSTVAGAARGKQTEALCLQMPRTSVGQKRHAPAPQTLRGGTTWWWEKACISPGLKAPSDASSCGFALR